MDKFIIFPAIDLLHGQVVRLERGDPARQTHYDRVPAHTAQRWLKAGANWLHLVNLDGAFGDPDEENQQAITAILATAASRASVQLGGGLRSVAGLEQAFCAGIQRAVLGTWAIQHPEVTQELIQRWGSERIAVSLDAEEGKVKVKGWKEATSLDALELALRLKDLGLRWLVYTDIARDGLGTGLNLDSTVEIARHTGLSVIGSGGVFRLEDVRRVQDAGLAGIIIGRALYNGSIDADQLFRIFSGS